MLDSFLEFIRDKCGGSVTDCQVRASPRTGNALARWACIPFGQGPCVVSIPSVSSSEIFVSLYYGHSITVCSSILSYTFEFEFDFESK